MPAFPRHWGEYGMLDFLIDWIGEAAGLLTEYLIAKGHKKRKRKRKKRGGKRP